MGWYEDKDPDEYRRELREMGATVDDAEAAVENLLSRREAR